MSKRYISEWALHIIQDNYVSCKLWRHHLVPSPLILVSVIMITMNSQDHRDDYCSSQHPVRSAAKLWNVALIIELIGGGFISFRCAGNLRSRSAIVISAQQSVTWLENERAANLIKLFSHSLVITANVIQRRITMLSRALVRTSCFLFSM